MIVLVAVYAAAAGMLAGMVLGSVATRRRLTEEMIRQEERAQAFAAAADRLADEAHEAGVWVTKLRALVVDQAVIVRAALGRAQKRRIPAGAS